MPMRPPPPSNSLTELDASSQKEAVDSLYSVDAVRLKAAVGRYCHPDLRYTSHIAEATGRWNVWRLLQASTALFSTRLEHHTSVLNQHTLKGLVWFDQVFKPRVPLVQGLLPEVRCPTLLHLTWTKQADGTYLIKDMQQHVSIAYLPSLFGPAGTWLYSNLVRPTGKLVLDTACEITTFATAVRVFIEKQLLGSHHETTQRPQGGKVQLSNPAAAAATLMSEPAPAA